MKTNKPDRQDWPIIGALVMTALVALFTAFSLVVASRRAMNELQRHVTNDTSDTSDTDGTDGPWTHWEVEGDE